MPNYQLGRLGTAFVGEESTYGTAPTLTSAMHMRHLDLGLMFNPFGRVNSDEKKTTPGVQNRFDRRVEASFDLREAYARPSGVIGTIPECHLMFKHAFGTAIVGTGSSTVAAAPAPTSTVFTLASAAAFAVGEFVLIHIAAGGSAGRYARVITAKSTNEITVSPALPAAPATGDTVKAGVTYRMANGITNSLSIWRYLTDLKFLQRGCVIDKFKLTHNNNEEIKFSCSGPAKDQVTTGLPAHPGIVTVGGNPPSGLRGGLTINGTAYKFLNADIEFTNGNKVENEEYGTDRAQAFYRDGRRDATFSITSRVTNDTALYALAESAASFTMLLQTGTTEGNIVASYAPSAELDEVPETPDDDGALQWSFKGTFKETATGNDELVVGML